MVLGGTGYLDHQLNSCELICSPFLVDSIIERAPVVALVADVDDVKALIPPGLYLDKVCPLSDLGVAAKDHGGAALPKLVRHWRIAGCPNDT